MRLIAKTWHAHFVTFRLTLAGAVATGTRVAAALAHVVASGTVIRQVVAVGNTADAVAMSPYRI